MAVRSKVRDRSWRDIDTPERLRGSLQSEDYSGTNHRGMRDSKGVTEAVLPSQPTLHTVEEVRNRLAAMRCRINVGEPLPDAVRVRGLNFVQRLASP
jgi:hypothetical protein